jgi:hypothetical protein
VLSRSCQNEWALKDDERKQLLDRSSLSPRGPTHGQFAVHAHGVSEGSIKRVQVGSVLRQDPLAKMGDAVRNILSGTEVRGGAPLKVSAPVSLPPPQTPAVSAPLELSIPHESLAPSVSAAVSSATADLQARLSSMEASVAAQAAAAKKVAEDTNARFDQLTQTILAALAKGGGT